MSKKSPSRTGFVRSISRFFRRIHYALFCPSWMKKYEKFQKM